MENMGVFYGFLWGLFGGASAEVYVWYNVTRGLAGHTLGPSKKLSYWISTILRTLIGGGLVVAYIQSGIPLTPILAIHVGITTPLIIGAFMSQTPPTEPGGWD